MNYIERKEDYLKNRIIPQTANEDFAEFWQTHVGKLKEIPVKIQKRLLKTPYDKTITTYEISFNTHDDTVVYAYFSKPANMEGKLPCVVWYHGGGGKRRIYPNIVACGVCCFAMDVRSQHGKTFDLAQYEMGTDYVIGSMVTHDILYKDSYYLKNIYLDAVRALDVVALLPEVDSEKIVTFGESQGGALSIVASALNDKSVKCYASVPSYGCLWNRVENGSGVFKAVNILLGRNPELTDQVFDTLTYFDVNNMVSLLKVPAHYTLGLSDPTCLPEFVYSFYHHTNTEKELTIAPFTGHTASEDYLNKVYTEFSEMAEGL